MILDFIERMCSVNEAGETYTYRPEETHQGSSWEAMHVFLLVASDAAQFRGTCVGKTAGKEWQSLNRIFWPAGTSEAAPARRAHWWCGCKWLASGIISTRVIGMMRIADALVGWWRDSGWVILLACQLTAECLVNWWLACPSLKDLLMELSTAFLSIDVSAFDRLQEKCLTLICLMPEIKIFPDFTRNLT